MTDCDEAGDYVVPNVLNPRDLVSRPYIMDETVPHNWLLICSDNDTFLSFLVGLVFRNACSVIQVDNVSIFWQGHVFSL